MHIPCIVYDKVNQKIYPQPASILNGNGIPLLIFRHIQIEF